MFDGDITLVSFAPDRFGDPKFLDFMQMIKVSEDPVLTARMGVAVPTRVTAILTDGQRISREVDYAPGFAERPMNRAEVERKFRGNVGKRWPQQRTDAVLQALWALDQVDDLSVLLPAGLRCRRNREALRRSRPYSTRSGSIFFAAATSASPPALSPFNRLTMPRRNKAAA